MNVNIGLIFSALGMGSTRSALNGLNTRITRIGTSVRADTAEFERLGSIIRRTSQGPALDRMRQQQDRLRESIRASRMEMHRLATEDLRGRIGSGIAAAGSLYAGRGVALADRSTEKSLRDSAIIFGVARTQDEENIKRQAELVAKDTRTPLNDVLGGVNVLAQEGMAAKDVSSALPIITQAAKAWNVSVDEMARTILSTFKGLGVQDNARAANIIGTGGKLGKFEVKDVALYLPSLAPGLASLGLTGEKGLAKTVGYLQASREGSGSAEEAVTNMQNFINKVSSREFSERFEEVTGLNLEQQQKVMIGKGYDALGGTMELVKAYMTKRGQGHLLENLKNAETPEAQQKAIQDLQEAHGLGDLFTDMQASKFIRSIIKFDDLRRTVTEQAMTGAPLMTDLEHALDTTDARLVRLGSAWESTVREMAMALKPLTDGVLDLTSGALERVKEMAVAHPEATRNLMMVGTTLVALKIAGVLIGVIGAGMRMLSLSPGAGIFRLGAMMPTFAAGLVRFRAALPAIGATLLGVARFAGLFARGLLLGLGPVGLLIGAGYLLITHWDSIKSAASAMASWVGGLWTNMTDSISMGLGDWLDSAGAAFTAYRDEISTGIGNLMADLMALPGKMWSAGKEMGAGLAKGITSGATAVWDGGVQLANEAVTGVKDTLGIKSPSRVMIGLGAQVTEGLRLGIARGEVGVLGQMSGLARGLATPMLALPLMSAPMMPTYASASAVSGQAVTIQNHYTITIYAAEGQNEQALARAVMDEIERQQAGKRRAALGDWA